MSHKQVGPRRGRAKKEDRTNLHEPLINCLRIRSGVEIKVEIELTKRLVLIVVKHQLYCFRIDFRVLIEKVLHRLLPGITWFQMQFVRNLSPVWLGHHHSEVFLETARRAIQLNCMRTE